MKNTRRLNRALATALALAALAFASPPTAAAGDHALVSKRRVVIVRTGRLARQFPERKRAIVNLPVVSGIADAAVLRKVRAALDLKNVFDTSLAEYREDAWLEELDFKVNYNKNYILDITLWAEGTGAYPDTNTQHRAISLKTGGVLKARDVFKPDALDTLARMANESLRAAVAEQIKVVEEDGDLTDKDSLKEELKGLTFGVKNLDDFKVSDAGVTFLYDAGFPHVIQALEPDGEYFFTYAQLAPYIKRDGPLGTFVK
ncbi:MAG TPA: hypothetical protein VGX48_07280 [Pyrinomonadaceae bacterium]|jgi:hypothetical protein|nr:hypothetical protein [Pyrinomonadaceae bacterium]